MRRRSQNLDFKIHVDESCLSTPMDEETSNHPNEERQLVLHGTTAEGRADEVEAHGKAARDSIAGHPPLEDLSTKPATPPHADEEDEETPRATQLHSDDLADDEPSYHADDDDGGSALSSSSAPSSRRESTEPGAARRASLRTEALIQAAARAVVKRIERNSQRLGGSGERDEDGHGGGGDDNAGQHEADGDDIGDASLLSGATEDHDKHEDGEHEHEHEHEHENEHEHDESSYLEGTELSLASEVDDLHHYYDDEHLPGLSQQQPRVSEGHMLPATSSDDHSSEGGHGELDDDDDEVPEHLDATEGEEAEGEVDTDDVFSDRSPRSSLGGSVDGASSGEAAAAVRQHQLKRRSAEKRMSHLDEVLSQADSASRGESPGQNGSSSRPQSRATTTITTGGGTREPRISSISQYDLSEGGSDDTPYMPSATLRSRGGTQRPPFRTPSAVRAMQMSSPPPSVFSGGASPRSARRQGAFSPKSAQRPTPSRLKRIPPPEPAPLVLLHATLLPLRWAWADVVMALDEAEADDGAADTREGGGKKAASELLRTLRESWRLLADRMGDTVLERGVLLPHPQGDYEVLEERLLEALELPQRRRARILECGHYLGPSNMDDEDDADAFDDTYSIASSRVPPSRLAVERKHWCATCRTEIRYESLGPGRVFRIKVYASNGLMKAGAWSACWREMERVDVEVEPLLDPATQDELERVARRLQQREQLRQQQHQQQHGRDTHLDDEDDLDDLDENTEEQQQLDAAAAAAAAMASSPPMGPHSAAAAVRAAAAGGGGMSPRAADRRRRDEERLREIYGHTPPPATFNSSPVHNAATAAHHHLAPPTSGATANSSMPPPPDSAASPTTSPTVGGFPSVTTTGGIPSVTTTAATGTTAVPTTNMHHHGGGTPLPPGSFHPADSSPPSPSEEAFERRENRRAASMGAGGGAGGRRGYYQTASLPELLWEAARVAFLRDRKNAVIAGLCFVVLVLVLARAPPGPPPHHAAVVGVDVNSAPIAAVLTTTAGAGAETVVVTFTETLPAATVASSSVSAAPSAAAAAVESDAAAVAPVASANKAASGKVDGTEDTPPAEKMVVRVYETVTQTETVKVTASEVPSVDAGEAGIGKADEKSREHVEL